MKQILALFALGALISALSGCPSVVVDDDAECDPLHGDLFPTVTIDDPDNSLMLDADDAINWVVRVEDEDGDVEDVLLEAQDLSDGTPELIDFAVPSPNEDGRATFGMPGGTLGIGVVTVRIHATDEQGCSVDDSVVVCIDVADAACPSR